MSIIDKLNNVEPVRTGKTCALCSILLQLNDEDKNAILSALSMPVTLSKRITDRQISNILKSEGYEISCASVFRHRQNHMDKQ